MIFGEEAIEIRLQHLKYQFNEEVKLIFYNKINEVHDSLSADIKRLCAALEHKKHDYEQGIAFFQRIRSEERVDNEVGRLGL